MPFAIEPTVNPTLDIPAPIVSVPQGGDRTSGSTPSFQDHLNRAGRSQDGSGSNSSSSSSSAAHNDRVDEHARSNDDAGDRAEADRRDDAAAAENNGAESSAPKADGSKPKPADGDTKVEGKKKSGEHHKKDEKEQGDDAAAVVAVAVGAQDAPVGDEITLTADEAAAEAEGKGIEPASAADGKQKGQAAGSPLDPTVGKQTKAQDDANVGAKVAGSDDAAAAALAEAQAKDAAARQAADASTDPTPIVPAVSDLHSTKIKSTDDKKPKTRAEFAGETQATDVKSDVVDTGVIDATKAAPTPEPEAAIADQAGTPDKSDAKSGNASGANADPSFTAQLQGAVEAAAAATTSTTTAAAADTATTLDAPKATSSTSAGSTDSTKATTTKTSDAVSTAVESLRANSAKDSTSNRVAGEDGRQADGLSTADRARLVQRVARAVRTAQDRGGELQIRLSPPELGQLRLQIQMTDGTLSARIEAESPQAKQVITENLGQLRERLAEQNVRVDRIDVELMNAGNGGSPNLPDRRQDFSHDGPTPRGFGSTTRNGGSGDAAAVDAAAPAAATTGPGRLNVVI